jgi:eukaryotic-like serine/threonine-protein kinase
MTLIDTQPASRAAAARRVGSWDLAGLVGAGSVSRVYRARAADTPDDRPAPYAVKILRRRWESDARAVALFRREAQVGRGMSHPRVISVLAAGLREPPYYLVMPWLEGWTLRTRLDAPERLDVPTALWIGRQVAEAMGALAAASWRHGDIKPSNVFLSPGGHVTLLDLGFARREHEDGSVVDRCVLGTCNYLAPETITSTLAADVRSDIYSLGVVLFEMLAGRLPFEGDTLEALVVQHRQSRPPDLRQLASHVPQSVAALVHQMLAKDPLRRPQTPGELIDRLSRLEIHSFADRARP